MTKGHFGDVPNISTQGNSRYGGVIAGGMFLWQFAKDLGVPVLVLSQLNRRQDDRGAAAPPKLSDLRESGSIEQDADVVVLLHKPKKEIAGADGSYDPTIMVSAIIAKQRNGPTGEVQLVFLRGCTRFQSAAKASAPEPEPEPVLL